MNLNLIAPINQLGYGIAGLNILKSLRNLDVNVSLWPIGQPQVTTQEDRDVVVECIENSKKYDPKADCIRIWHQHDLSQFVGKGRHIGFPIFELDDFNSAEKHQMKCVDRLFVCSEWAKDVIYNQKWNSPPVDVIPLGVDISLFKPEMSQSKRTIFFNCGKWEVRKGHDFLGKVFIETFSQDEDVELWMMCENPFSSKEETKAWESLYVNNELFRSGKIKLIPRVQTHQEVYNIMKEVDCGIFPSRAEGWNLEALEILSCGKQLIITDYSAHSEFCNNSNSHLIMIKEKELSFDNKWFFGQGSWAKIDQSHFSDISKFMRKIHDEKQNGVLELNNSGISTANKFTWKNTAERILNALKN